jgi:hypothetical protein
MIDIAKYSVIIRSCRGDGNSCPEIHFHEWMENLLWRHKIKDMRSYQVPLEKALRS